MSTRDKRPALDPSEAIALAALAEIELDEASLRRLTADLGRIVEYVGQLAEVDVSGAPPTAHVVLERLPLRNDEPRPSLERERILAEAPEHAEGGFAVPTFVDEG